MAKKERSIYYLPCYGVPETARILRLPVRTLYSWVRGQPNFKPIITPAQNEPLLLSFVNLVEAYVMGIICRRYGFSFQGMRKSLEYVRKELGIKSEHILADQVFQTNGLDLYIEHQDQFVNIHRRKGQFGLKDLKGYFQRIERDPKGLAVRLFPFTRSGKAPDEPKSIMIDPEISFGRPVLSKTGIPIEIIWERYQAGESIPQLSKDYERPPNEIEEAIRCENEIRRRAA